VKNDFENLYFTIHW